MADRLNGYRILILETREEAQFSRLLTEQGADVLQCPMFTIHDAPDPAPVEAWIRRSIEKPFDDVVLMTGEGLRRLMKVVRRIGQTRRYESIVKGLRAMTALMVLRNKAIKPLLAAAQGLRPSHGAQNPSVIDTHYDTIRTAMQGVFQELGLAA